jgi:hypothetical protein
MRSTLALSIAPSARNGVGAMGKTPLASEGEWRQLGLLELG